MGMWFNACGSALVTYKLRDEFKAMTQGDMAAYQQRESEIERERAR